MDALARNSFMPKTGVLVPPTVPMVERRAVGQLPENEEPV